MRIDRYFVIASTRDSKREREKKRGRDGGRKRKRERKSLAAKFWTSFSLTKISFLAIFVGRFLIREFN